MLKQAIKRSTTPALALTIALTMALPGGVAAATQPDAGPGKLQQLEGAHPHSSQAHKGRRPGMKLRMMGGVHQQTYLALLIDKYAPETKSAWQPVLQESARLHKELKALQATHGKGASGKKPAFEPKQTEQTQQEAVQEMKRQHEVFERFTAAIEAGDPSRIKASLAELMPVWQTRNARLAAFIGHLKQKQAAAPSHTGI
ncbi:hypothetical protein IDH44_21550 [Paenibacillus sp. IB182496]|uniref:DUF4142 domain-containing protein n=1 Tax=Paenibacillus sabuli TaxID=2772509 RepID=A0A927GUK0_9BACL|nr:hypothetical protein [Paenibacillus sabuli]MBD2847787.1 hypothetical protein [Paenibacillus sabuli]